ncbi:MAG: methylated-DNA--[protein]-cysteine S-methyltransferase [Acidimicrobiales bacterium]
MTADHYALFGTSIGRCGIAWGERGVLAVQLPEKSDSATRARLRQRCQAATEAPPPADVARAVDGIVALLQGQATDLSFVVLDMRGVPPFQRRVLEALRTIPPGRTVSYGEMAALAGTPGGARAVGQAVRRNPFAIVVPCHRVLAAGGGLGGFSAGGGVVTKLRLLSIEGARAGEWASLFDGDGDLGFDPEVAVAELRSADADLAALIDDIGPFAMRLRSTPSVFAALAEAIVHQQLSGRAAVAIHTRLCVLFPRPLEGPTAIGLLRLPDETLRAAGLSRSKVLSLRDLARHACEGEIPTLAETRGMDDESIVERLSRVRGVGRWTVEMLLMFRLGRPDVLPTDDYGVRKGFAAAFGLGRMPTPTEVAERGARWAPYRTVASWYLWRAAERPGS